MLEQKLLEIFSFTNFRPGQKEIIESILNGNDTLALMPTGAGKSLCFQFPAIVLPGLTVVISPLIALMKNQVDSLTARNIPATFLNSSLSSEEQISRCKKIANNEYKLLYVAPERFLNQTFANWFSKLDVSIFAVDEAHCISSWGHDFRPEYQKLGEIIDLLPKRPITVAFTATATQLVAQDIQNKLKLKTPNIFIRGFDRPNLKFYAREKVPLNKRKQEALRLINAISGSGIIYTLTIKEAEEVNQYLCQNNINSTVYHARLDQDKRSKIQDDFMENRYQVVVATIAFGMGIDKADIRYVIHIGMPPNLERYYQEAGRAGRDDETAYCIILHNGRDSATHHFFIQKSIEQMKSQGKTSQEIKQLINLKYRQLESMQHYIESSKCKRKIILEYFQDPKAAEIKNCKGCDRCLNYKWEQNVESELHEPIEPRQKKQKDGLSNTVLETARLYESAHTPEQIAKIRNLGYNTIIAHLVQWYAGGGNFDYDSFVSPKIEEKIQKVLEQLGDSKLSPIKDALPKSISYDQIKFVIAKGQRKEL